MMAAPETLLAKAEEVLGGVPAFPPFPRGRPGSCWRSPRLLGRRAPARGIPLLWGRSCHAFARWMMASPAAQPSRLRTFPGSLGKRGKEGLHVEMRGQKRRVQVTLHRA